MTTEQGASPRTSAPDASYARVPGVLSRTLPQGIVVMTPERREVVLLADSARVLWESLDEPRSDLEVVRLVADRYAVPPDTIDGDVSIALDQLAALGVVERRP